MTAVVATYFIASLVVGGAAAAYEIWHRSVMLDRADGRGRFPSPKMGPGELVFFGLFVAALWPLLAAAAIADYSRSASR